jgi:hypothetical protein
MFFSRKWMFLLLAFALICIAPPRHAHAYIDPGTGNYLFQILLTSVFGALFALKIFWTKIRNRWACVRTILSDKKQSSAGD